MQYEKILSELQQFYEQDAEERDRTPKTPWKLAERQRFLDVLLQENKLRFLEIGAGTGQDSLFFQEQGMEVICTDFSPSMVARCRQKGLTAYQMDFLHLDFPPHAFDAIYALNCLLHVPKSALPTVLEKIANLLVVDGLFYLGMYGGEDREGIFYYGSQQHGRFYSYYATPRITAILEQYFEIFSFRSIELDIGERACFQSFILRN